MNDKTQTTMVLAGLAMGICGLAGIAYFVGWTPWSHAPIAIPSAVPKPPPAVTTQSGVVLLPGETLVAPPDAVAVLPPVPAPAPALAPATRGPSPPRYAKPAPPPAIAKQSPRPAPPPQYSLQERRSNAYERSTRSVCLSCGVVTGISRNDYDWEVRVRLDDGRRATHRFYDRPRFELGDAVRLEDGRLVAD